ncbi:hypothetical protein AWI35_22320 [Klebsiella aerogenes]|nr:hypothetical protein AWI09_23360 [Klebsiella aerogenes]KUR21507.1 hypothetical protein AWI35_22320 [Klebsiella aerogenes]
MPEEATPENIKALASIQHPSMVIFRWSAAQCNAAADTWNARRAATLKQLILLGNMRANACMSWKTYCWWSKGAE